MPFWAGEAEPEGPAGASRVLAPQPGTAAGVALGSKAPPRELTLVRLAAEIARSLSTIGRVAVEGEVYRPQTSKAGWVYFTLRERAAQLSVACPARNARRCRAVNGERALVVGSLVWGNDRGQLVLEAEEVLPVGDGAVAAMIAEVRARLAAEGLLGRPRLALPLLPAAIGVVCGTEAAVRKDIESVVSARFAGYPLVFEETTVSGPGAAAAITAALSRLAARTEVEVVVLARGGGDATALLAWSDEDLCRAIAGCAKPVVSAIGHEQDRPLCDEVADARFGTPSIAAAAVVPDRAALGTRLEALMAGASSALDRQGEAARLRLGRAQVVSALASGLQRATSRLSHGGDRLAWSCPAPAVQEARRRLESCDWESPASARVAMGEERLAALGRQASALSPQHTVQRGFAVVRRHDGSVVRGPEDVEPGEVIELVVARGSIAAAVLDGARPPGRAPAKLVPA